MDCVSRSRPSCSLRAGVSSPQTPKAAAGRPVAVRRSERSEHVQTSNAAFAPQEPSGDEFRGAWTRRSRFRHAATKTEQLAPSAVDCVGLRAAYWPPFGADDVASKTGNVFISGRSAQPSRCARQFQSAPQSYVMAALLIPQT